ncbi:MAG: NADH:flavin oxidoreductase [Rhodospirillales bacterium]
MSPKSDPVLQPFAIRSLKLRNRIVSTPHAPAYGVDGMPGERYQLYYEEKAKGGIGLAMFGGSSNVAPDSPSVFGQLYVGDDRIVPYFRQFSERMHKLDCGLVCQITHMGRRTTWNDADWLPVIAPSRIREPAHRGFPKVMDRHDIKRVRKAYADAALRCREGGLDGAEVLVHGHLPDQFLSPLTNKRTDEYGGSLENRLRFTLEMYDDIRAAVGPDFVLGARVGIDEGVAGGVDFDEGCEAARILADSGLIDYMTVNFGQIHTDAALADHIPGMQAPLAPWVPMLAKARPHISVPIAHACRIADLSSARYAVEEGLVDMVGMTRAHIADPHIVNKLKRGEEHRIRPCVGANHCLDRLYQGGEALCLHNVSTGREATMPHVIQPSTGPRKKIVVVGAGPAGLEAARVSAERGHDVVLFEATGDLGGQIVLAAKAGWRKDLIGIVDWYRGELDHLGIDVRWNTFADRETVLAEEPDIVVVATGGLPDDDVAPGQEHCLNVWDVLSGSADVSGDVLVYDDNGQHQGLSCADFLSTRDGCAVELVTPDRVAAAELGNMNFAVYMRHFYKNGVTMTPDHRLARIEKDGNKLRAFFTNEFGGPPIERTADHIVIEHGTVPLDDLYADLIDGSANQGVTDYDALIAGEPQPEGIGHLLFRVGDAVASRTIHAAIYDALRLCKDF